MTKRYVGGWVAKLKRPISFLYFCSLVVFTVSDWACVLVCTKRRPWIPWIRIDVSGIRTPSLTMRRMTAAGGFIVLVVQMWTLLSWFVILPNNPFPFELCCRKLWFRQPGMNSCSWVLLCWNQLLSCDGLCIPHAIELFEWFVVVEWPVHTLDHRGIWFMTSMSGLKRLCLRFQIDHLLLFE